MASNILSARYAKPEPPGGYPADAAVIAVHATYGEQHRRATDDIDDGGMRAFLADGGVIGPYVAPPVVPPTADDVRAEANRRIEAVYPLYKQLNIVRTGNGALATMSAFIDAIRVASNAMEASPPADYRDDSHWE